MSRLVFAEEGKSVSRPVKGGVILYLREVAPAGGGSKNILDKIRGDDEPEEELEILGPAEVENI